MPKGRPHKYTPCPHFCPACTKRLQQRKTRAPSFRCPNCGRSYDLIEGELRPKQKAVKTEAAGREERPAMEWWETERLNGWEPSRELLRELVREVNL